MNEFDPMNPRSGEEREPVGVSAGTHAGDSPASSSPADDRISPEGESAVADEATSSIETEKDQAAEVVADESAMNDATQETPVDFAEGAEPVSAERRTPVIPSPPPATTYRWTYADQVGRDTTSAAKKRRNGTLIYALVMTGVFLISFALLIGVLIAGNGGGDDHLAAATLERVKDTVVVIEVSKANGTGTGTGIILTSDGYIATNHHVIEDGTKVRVTFYDGTYAYAEVVGSSEMDDLAVLKVKRNGLPSAFFADSDTCYVGQTVYAIGTPAGPDFAWTTTKGIISYKDREVKIYDETDGTMQKKLRLLQTDANVNPGNSGGPLINARGEVVGVVSMKLSEGYEGIGFAIPSDGAVEILEAIMRDGHAGNINSSLSYERPVLGIVGGYMEADSHYLLTDNQIQYIPEEELDQYAKADLVCPGASGIYVVSVTEGMDAAKKLAVGDVITAVQGVEVTSMNALMDVINNHYAGDQVSLQVYRDGQTISVEIVLSAQKKNS